MKGWTKYLEKRRNILKTVFFGATIIAILCLTRGPCSRESPVDPTRTLRELAKFQSNARNVFDNDYDA